MEGKKQGIIKPTLILAVSTFIAKIIGALYKIPLTNLIGGFGLGLYQSVFPVYAILLDFSSSGLPQALSKLIANANNDEKKASSYLIGSLRLFSLLGLLFSLLLACFSPLISYLQGNKSLTLSYLFLSPSIFLVAIISCFRGYFQGKLNTKPTAISQIFEQVFKLAFGLFFIKLFMPNVVKGVAYSILAITVSEFFALIYLIFRIKKENLRLNLFSKSEKFFIHAKKLVINVLPITIIGVLIPFSHFIDSFLVVNILSKYRGDATVLYGLYSGAVNTIINLPVSICYSLAVVVIPLIAKRQEEKNKTSLKNKSLFLTLGFGVFSMIGCMLFSRLIVNILFNSISAEEKEITANILKYSACNIVFLSMLQTENAIIFGENNLYAPLKGVFVGLVVKTVLLFILLPNPKFNIYGAVISQIACYFIGSLVNLRQVYKVKNASKEYNVKRLCVRE